MAQRTAARAGKVGNGPAQKDSGGVMNSETKGALSGHHGLPERRTDVEKQGRDGQSMTQATGIAETARESQGIGRRTSAPETRRTLRPGAEPRTGPDFRAANAKAESEGIGAGVGDTGVRIELVERAAGGSPRERTETKGNCRRDGRRLLRVLDQ